MNLPPPPALLAILNKLYMHINVSNGCNHNGIGRITFDFMGLSSLWRYPCIGLSYSFAISDGPEWKTSLTILR